MEQTFTKSRSFGGWFFVSAIAFILSYFVARGALEREMATAWRVVFALMPIPFFVWFLLKFIHNVRNADELERRIDLEALAIAFPLALVMLMILGLLEVAVPLNPDDWSYRHVWYLLPLFYFGGMAIARKRYL
ncbi:MAG TPA: hypothetical protein VGR15_04975 [Bacteroidota bacterium]|jgi:hypothetical protein|nr:hypothetical protein [Bacteroidota bacterium]